MVRSSVHKVKTTIATMLLLSIGLVGCGGSGTWKSVV